MSRKIFVPYDTIRDDAIRLAQRIHHDGFDPDVIYVSLRGGAYMGNVISEYFKVVRRDARPVFYAAVVARSYTDINTKHRVSVDGWTYSPEHLRSGDNVLLVDDIFDTGRTINHLVNVIMEHGIPRRDIRVAVHDYKIRHYVDHSQPILPDYFCNKQEIAGAEQDTWLHYLSHELVGLSPEEVATRYPEPDVQRILSGIL